MDYNPALTPSILHRPVREPCQGAAETLERQYQREQEYWAAKQARSQETQDRLLKSLYPSREDKFDAAADARHYLDQHQFAKEQHQRQLELEERAWAQSGPVSPMAVPPNIDARPWQATTYTSYASKLEEDLARRAMHGPVAQENLLAIQKKVADKQQRDEADRQSSRHIVTDESSFWNLGSVNDKWRAPDRRSPRGHAEASPTSQEPAHLHAPYAAGGGCADDSAHVPPPWAEEKPMDTPWATAYSPTPATYQHEQHSPTQQRYASRPGTAACPYAAGGAYAGEQYSADPQLRQYGSADAPVPAAMSGLPSWDVKPMGTPWATEYSPAAAPQYQHDPHSPSQQRYASRPGTAACPFGTDREAAPAAAYVTQQELVQQQLLIHQEQQELLQQRQQLMQQQQEQQLQQEQQHQLQQQQLGASVSRHLRYSTRPDSRSCPFATDSDHMQLAAAAPPQPQQQAGQRFPWL